MASSEYLARKKFPFSVECKNVEKFGNSIMWDAIKQSVDNAGKHKPLVVFSKNHQKEYVIIRLEDLIDLLKQLNEK